MGQMHALVIDDNAQNLKVLTQMLLRQGVVTTEVINPATLPTLVRTLRETDVFFVDLEMPGLDGYAVKDLIRSHFASARIIAYTVHVGEINMARQVGFDGLLCKPLDYQRFPGQLDRILRGEKVWERA